MADTDARLTGVPYREDVCIIIAFCGPRGEGVATVGGCGVGILAGEVRSGGVAVECCGTPVVTGMLLPRYPPKGSLGD